MHKNVCLVFYLVRIKNNLNCMKYKLLAIIFYKKNVRNLNNYDIDIIDIICKFTVYKKTIL